MRQDKRRPFVEALQQAREAAYDPGEYVEQESFMRASEIRALAQRARIVARNSVLDLCCGIAGPGRFLTRELGCSYVGVDSSASAVSIARERAQGLPCRFVVAQVPPLPPGAFDAVLLFETMLAFRDKGALVEAISLSLSPRGRFAFTVEEGMPLTQSERARMPDADTVWLAPLDEVQGLLARAGLAVRWQKDLSRSHRAVAESLADAYAADAPAIASQIGRRALDELLAAHRLWSQWLASGRVRKIAVVAERPESLRQLPVSRRSTIGRVAEFVPPDFDVPLGLETSEFVLEPLGPEHNELDYDAWTSSMEHIAATPGWGDSRWPREMTPDENRADLQRHADDFRTRKGFTYTVLDPAGRDVIGCVYIYPLRDGDHDARALSWVRESHADLDTPLWHAVSEWLASDWPFASVDYAPRA